MTEHFGRATSEFFITAPTACPYLPDRLERKVFTLLQGASADRANEVLTHRGFRRSQNIIYRPACDGCSACVAVRTPTSTFKPSRSQRRVLNRNRDIVRHVHAPVATEEQFSLLRAYLDQRHGEGGMADMTILDFVSMVEETAIETTMIEYRHRRSGALLACALTDRLSDGLSMVYSFFDPSEARRSLGSFMILDHIRLAAEEGAEHVYLGYWITGSAKMAYKARFQPMEQLTRAGWRPLSLETD
ncbi:MAG: arginyltransferase [Pseudomonadota bacterium]